MWKTLDLQAMHEAVYGEQTTSGNVGAFAVPLGQPLRRTSPGPQVDPEELRDDDLSAYISLDRYLK